MASTSKNNSVFKSNTLDLKCCFWDKHEFETGGIMCPIEYKPKQIVRKKKEYYMNQNVPENYTEKTTEGEDPVVISAEFFFDDMFCSLECCLAWIEDNAQNPKYSKSKHILYRIYDMKNKTLPLRPANHWRTLKKFGGFLSIQEFRSFSNFYTEKDQENYPLENSQHSQHFLKTHVYQKINYVM